MVLWQTVAMLVAWLVLTVWLVVQMMAFGDGDLDQRMRTFARILAEAAGPGTGPDEALRQRLASTERIFVDGIISGIDATDGYVPLYQVWSRDGARRLSSAGAGQLAMPHARDGFAEFDDAGHRYRSVAVTSTDGLTRVTMAERADQRFGTPALKVIALSQLLILVWCVAATLLAARRGFEPLQNLARQLSERRAGDLSPLAPARLFSETAPVVEEVNGLLAREAARLQTERGFLADAAHELRTPLAAINAQAHLLVSTVDAAARIEVEVELQQGMDRVSHLLTQLLTLARIEAAPMAVARERLDVAELFRQRLAPLSRFARARGIELRFETPDVLMASARRTNLISLIDNLVDNAIRYTQVGGHVEVRLIEAGLQYELTVRDDGPGIALADRQRVFERFVRLASHGESGSGLGLAIVQRVAAAESTVLRYIDGLSDRGIGFAVRLETAPGTT